VKLLLLYSHEYWLRPYEKNVASAPDAPPGVETADAVVALIHVEAGDENAASKVVTKAIKQIKWVAGKFGSKRAVLHSFAHLASTRSSPEAAAALIEDMRVRLAGAGYDVATAPFGWFNEFRLHVAGPSLAKVFVEIGADPDPGTA